MATAVGAFSARTNHRGRLETQVASQNIAGNFSTVNWQLYAEKTAASSSYALDAGGGGSVTIGGNSIGIGAWSYDFRSNSIYALGSGTVNIGHNPDGTLNYGISFSVSAPGTLGSASGSSSETVSTIPRASTSTFTPQPVEAGAVLTISTNPAAGFTHNLYYYFGGASGTIATGVGTSVTWSVPLSLLNEMPNSVSGVGYIRTETYSGATFIGSTNTSLTVSASAGIVPTFAAVTAAENVSAVSTIVGAYVQGLSKLNLAISGAAGVYGSSINSYKIDVAGQTINAVSGVTPAVIAFSGTVPIVATITDSRGRTATRTLNLSFLAYAPPAIDAALYSTRRALSDGTLNESGTYIRVDLKASSSSLIVSTVQKNNLTYKIYTRLRGDAAWTLKTTVAPAGVTFNNFDKVGIYAVENSWDVRVDVIDQFNTATIASTVATASIFMHWGPLGLGLGKFWEAGRGAVDVKGPIYQNDGKLVLDTDSLSAITGTISGTWTAGSPQVTITSGLNNGAVVTATIGTSADLQPGQSVVLSRINGTHYITGAILTGPAYPRQIRLATGPGISNYDSEPGDVAYVSTNSSAQRFGPLKATKTTSGWVVASGLALITSIRAAGDAIVTLPLGLRPIGFPIKFVAFSSGTLVPLIVGTDGVVRLTAAMPAGSWISLCNIQFNPDVTMLSMSGLLNGWAPLGGYRPPSYQRDGLGFTWMSGAISGGTMADGQNFWAQPESYHVSKQAHVLTTGAGAGPRGFRSNGGAAAGSNFASILNLNAGGATELHLDGPVYEDHSNMPLWLKPQPLQNGWVQFDALRQPVGYYKRADGLVALQGLVSGGTLGNPIMTLPPGYRPAGTNLRACATSTGEGRLDINGNGNVAAISGSTGWFALDGILFAPEQ